MLGKHQVEDLLREAARRSPKRSGRAMREALDAIADEHRGARVGISHNGSRTSRGEAAFLGESGMQSREVPIAWRTRR
jgi:hypothetical protein